MGNTPRQEDGLSEPQLLEDREFSPVSGTENWRCLYVCGFVSFCYWANFEIDAVDARESFNFHCFLDRASALQMPAGFYSNRVLPICHIHPRGSSATSKPLGSLSDFLHLSFNRIAVKLVL